MKKPEHRILVLGATGMCGHRVAYALKDYPVFGTTRARKDPRTKSAFLRHVVFGQADLAQDGVAEALVRGLEPTVVVNCAGLVLQRPEAKRADACVAMNAQLPHRLAAVADDIGARFIHVSTDCVFDGRRGNYKETDRLSPTDLYGRTKAVGEPDLDGRDILTLRTSLVGFEVRPPGFSLLMWLLSRAGADAHGYVNAFFSGVTTVEFAALVRLCIEEYPDLRGLYHVASRRISKFDLLSLANRALDLGIVLRPNGKVRHDRSLRGDALRTATGYEPPRWSQMMQDLAEEYPVYRKEWGCP